MAHFEVNESLKPARELMESLRGLATAWDRLTRVRESMTQQKTGDDAAGFAPVAAAYGYAGDSAAGANALASFAEIDSTFSANAAIRQLLAKHL